MQRINLTIILGYVINISIFMNCYIWISNIGGVIPSNPGTSILPFDLNIVKSKKRIVIIIQLVVYPPWSTSGCAVFKGPLLKKRSKNRSKKKFEQIIDSSTSRPWKHCNLALYSNSKLILQYWEFDRAKNTGFLARKCSKVGMFCLVLNSIEQKMFWILAQL